MGINNSTCRPRPLKQHEGVCVVAVAPLSLPAAIHHAADGADPGEGLGPSGRTVGSGLQVPT